MLGHALIGVVSLVFIYDWRIHAANLEMPMHFDSFQDLTDFDKRLEPESSQQYQSDFMNVRDTIVDDDEEEYSDEESEKWPSNERYQRNAENLNERRSVDFNKLKKQLGEVGSTFLNKLFGSENKKRGHERDVQNHEDKVNEKEDIPLKVRFQEDNTGQDKNSKPENLHNEHTNVKIEQGENKSDENAKTNEAETVYDETMGSPTKAGNEDEYCEVLKNKETQKGQVHHEEIEILPIKHENGEVYHEMEKEVEKEKAKALAHQIENVIEKEKEQVLNEELEKELEKEKTKALVHEIEKEIAEEKTAELNNKVQNEIAKEKEQELQNLIESGDQAVKEMEKQKEQEIVEEIEKEKEQKLHNLIENEKEQGDEAAKQMEKQKEQEMVKEIEKEIENKKAKEANHEVEKLLELEKAQEQNHKCQTKVNVKENELLEMDLYKYSPKTGDIKKEQTILLNVNPKQSKTKRALQVLQNDDYVIEFLPGNNKLTQIPTAEFAIVPKYNRKRRKRGNNYRDP